MKRDKVINRALSIFFTILSLAWIYPVFMIALNSFKKATAISTTTAFDLLTPETFNGLANYMHALNEQGFASAFMYSLIITVTSVVLILVCCSMCAWYVVRVNSKISNFFYYLFVFSMVVPFQMLMFTLSNLADRIGFNTPFNICFIYLGFGAGLAVFMFAGFVKNIPLEIEEAAMIDGCNPVHTFPVGFCGLHRSIILHSGFANTASNLPISQNQPSACFSKATGITVRWLPSMAL